MKKRELFFISLFTVTFLISAVVMAGDYLLKNLEKNMQQKYPNLEYAQQGEADADKEGNAPNGSGALNQLEHVSGSDGETDSVGNASSSDQTGNMANEDDKANGFDEKGNPINSSDHEGPDAGKLPEGASEEAGNENGTEAGLEEPTIKEFTTVEKDYFDDALFVGDSRTVGIMEYGDLNNATFFADSGMSVYGLEGKALSVAGLGKVTFEELLEQKQFGKIYIMLGINELGYQFNATAQKYQSMVEKVRSLQPDAIIYLCANMHVTKEKSDQEEIYNNANVNQMNAMIAGLADQQMTFYIDVNELFDDETGSLSADLSSDAYHVLGKYYVEWVEWLCTKAIL